VVLAHRPGTEVPYWINAKTKESGFSVVVETAQDALAKMAELAELAHSEVSAKDLSGNVIELAALQSRGQSGPRKRNGPSLGKSWSRGRAACRPPPFQNVRA
jgi:hypothetical protein